MADDQEQGQGLLGQAVGGIDPAVLDQLQKRLLAPTPVARPDQTPIDKDFWSYLSRFGNALGGAGATDSLSPHERQMAGFRALQQFGSGLMASAHYQPGKTVFSNLAQGFDAANQSVTGSEREGARVLAARQAALTEAQKQQIEGIKAALPLLQQQGALRGLPGSLLGNSPTGGNIGTGGSIGAAGDYTVPPALLPLYQQAAAKHGVPVELLIAQHKQESNLNAGATGGAGEVGLGQVLPATARSPGFGMAGVDPAALRDPAANIDFSAQYLAARAKSAGADLRTPEGVQKALRAYNGGGDPNYVGHVLRYVPGAQKALGGGGGGQAGVTPAVAPGQATPTVAPPAGRTTIPSEPPLATTGAAQTAGSGAPTGGVIPTLPPALAARSAADVSDIEAGRAEARASPIAPTAQTGVMATAQLSPLPPGMDANSREAYGILHPIVPPPEMQKLFNPGPDPEQLAAIAVRKQNAERDYQAARLSKDPVAASAKARELFDKATADENTLRENARKLGVDTQANYYKDRNAALDAAWTAEQKQRADEKAAARTHDNAIELARINADFDKDKEGARIAMRGDEKRMQDHATAAAAMQPVSDQLRQLPALMQNLPPGGSLSSLMGQYPQVASLLEKANIVSPGTADNVSIFMGLTNHLAGQLRVTGSGSMSDKDLASFKTVMPQLLQSPEGRLKAVAFLQNIADRVVEAQEFTDSYFKRIDPKTGKPAHDLVHLKDAINAPRRLDESGINQGGLGPVVPAAPKFEGPGSYAAAREWLKTNTQSGRPYTAWLPNEKGELTQQIMVAE